MRTYRQVVTAAAHALGVSNGRADHVGRQLQAAAIVPTGTGGRVPAHLTHEQCGALTLGVLSGAEMRDVAATVRRFAALEIDGIQFPAKSAPPTLGRLLASVLAGAVPGVCLTLDIDAHTAVVTGVGDQPLQFGSPTNTGRAIRRTASIAPRALHTLATSIQQ